MEEIANNVKIIEEVNTEEVIAIKNLIFSCTNNAEKKLESKKSSASKRAEAMKAEAYIRGIIETAAISSNLKPTEITSIINNGKLNIEYIRKITRKQIKDLKN